MSILFQIMKSAVLMYLILVVAIFFLQRHLIFHPTSKMDHDFKTNKLNHDGLNIQSLMTNPAASHVILYFGGNAEQVVYTAGGFKHLFLNHNTHLLQYRGYSGAQGQPSETGLYADALRLYDHVQSQQPKSIAVVGRSIGSAIATHLAANRPVDQLILVTPFDSVREVGQNTLPWLPVRWLIRDHFDAASNAHSIKTPTLIIWATQDEVIPAANTKALINEFPNDTPVIVKTIKAGHNDIDLNPNYFRWMKQFIQSNQAHP